MIYGKTITKIWVDDVPTDRRLVWLPTANKNTLAARASKDSWLVGVGEQDLDPVQRWCEEHNCGKRISFDRFRFQSKKEITMFLLRWS